MSKLRVLCLHGFTSNGQVHAFQLRRLTQALPEIDFTFPDAPHKVEISKQFDLNDPTHRAWADFVESASSAGHCAWWYARDEDSAKGTPGEFAGLDDSLRFLGDVMRRDGPFHAVWGFSQGACLAGMLCALLQDKAPAHPLRDLLGPGISAPTAGVIVSGFRARFPQYDGVYAPGINLPTLHVVGAADEAVTLERSEALMEVCHRPQILSHDGGHNIPKSDEDQQKIVRFIRSNLVENDSISKS